MHLSTRRRHNLPAPALVAAILLLSARPALPASFDAGASSSIVQSGQKDFANGTLSNVTVSGPTENATVTLALTEVDSWWRQRPAAYPSSRGFSRAATIFSDDKLLLFGGWDGGTHYSDTWLYDVSDGNWTRIEPAYPMSGKRVVLGNIGPTEKKTVAYYLDPQICTESAVDGVLTYRDAKGVFKTAPLKRRMVTVVCPIFHTEENINTAMLRRMITDELDQRDSKLFVVPERLPMQEAFSLGKRSVQGHDVRFVREFVEKEPYKAEAWYFGKTKGREAKLVIRVCARGEGRTLEFFVASGSRLAVTGLLAELRADLVKRQKESAPAFQRMDQVVDHALKERLDAEKPLLEKYADGS